MIPASDLVCSVCGKLLGDDLPRNSSGEWVRGLVDWSLSGVGAALISDLSRNFRLLGCDIATVLRLWWQEVSRYGEFRGVTGRRAFVAFAGVTYGGFKLLSGASEGVIASLAIGLFVPAVAICVRRLRDTGFSPWFMFAFPLLPFLLLVPTVRDNDNNVKQKESAS